MRQEGAVGTTMGDRGARADRVRQCVVDADKRVGHRQSGDGGGFGHVGAGGEVDAARTAVGRASKISRASWTQKASV